MADVDAEDMSLLVSAAREFARQIRTGLEEHLLAGKVPYMGMEILFRGSVGGAPRVVKRRRPPDAQDATDRKTDLLVTLRAADGWEWLAVGLEWVVKRRGRLRMTRESAAAFERHYPHLWPAMLAWLENHRVPVEYLDAAPVQRVRGAAA